MASSGSQLRSGFLAGVRRGWRSFVWILKIILPVSLLTAILHWTGWLDQISSVFNPLMSLLDLPPQAALPIISGMLTNLYVTIAAMTVIPFTAEQMTLIAVFSLICHNLIAEGIIQHKSGINVIKATLIRMVAAVLTVLVVGQFLGDTGQSIAMPVVPVDASPLLSVLKDWAFNLIVLLARILGILMAVMIMLELSEALGWTERVVGLFRPVMRVLGLSEQTAPLWVTSAAFGLMYGGAVTMDKARKMRLRQEELERLHISIGINHSMIEDPALFLALALNPFWLWVPKLITAVAAVHIYRAVHHLRGRLPMRRRS
jgi:spore maturation protein SpmB